MDNDLFNQAFDKAREQYPYLASNISRRVVLRTERANKISQSNNNEDYFHSNVNTAIFSLSIHHSEIEGYRSLAGIYFRSVQLKYPPQKTSIQSPEEVVHLDLSSRQYEWLFLTQDITER
ncbi:hypothetical protein KC851_03690 [Candidatus Kaiserbacteria bacterium]|nr:hypothetical protein [Candidatus Kaiserbacteria bacterium]